jgi:tetratricopeptide (TPR) repeat protein
MFTGLAPSLGLAYALSGRVAEALPLLEQVVASAASRQQMAGQALRVAELGQAYLLAGRLEDATVLAREALALARTHKEQGHQAYALRLLGELAAQHHPLDPEPAAASYRQALALAEALGMRPLVAHCHLGLGTLYAKSGQQEQARAALTTAINLYRAMDMPFWLPQAQAALAQVAPQ